MKGGELGASGQPRFRRALAGSPITPVIEASRPMPPEAFRPSAHRRQKARYDIRILMPGAPIQIVSRYRRRQRADIGQQLAHSTGRRRLTPQCVAISTTRDAIRSQARRHAEQLLMMKTPAFGSPRTLARAAAAFSRHDDDICPPRMAAFLTGARPDISFRAACRHYRVRAQYYATKPAYFEAVSAP